MLYQLAESQCAADADQVEANEQQQLLVLFNLLELIIFQMIILLINYYIIWSPHQ